MQPPQIMSTAQHVPLLQHAQDGHDLVFARAPPTPVLFGRRALPDDNSSLDSFLPQAVPASKPDLMSYLPKSQRGHDLARSVAMDLASRACR